MSLNLLNKYDLKKFPYRINWEITRKCNFNCSYCINQQGGNDVKTTNYTPEEIAGFFDKTNKKWLILITGGEPFLYPQFPEVCAQLTKQHDLQITTNLSLPGVYKFANIVNPDKIFMLSASFHSLERKNKNERNEFVEKCLYLKHKGFNVVINYVTHPKNIIHIDEDIKHFNELGFETFAIILRGTVDGRAYPESFEEKDIEIIKPYLLDFEIEYSCANGNLDFYGQKCEAGSKYFFMKPNGDISRCATLQKKIGNLFDDSFVMKEKLSPCIVHNCNDVYCGLASVTDKKAWALPIYLEKIKNKK
jgi:MoaA/NifB/PqqE/SkfB family radical SAM enzyme